MKPYEPYKEEAFLVETEPDRYAILFRGIAYKSTDDVTALGVLLFGLRPAGFNFRCIGDPSVALHLMQHAAHILHLHANGERYMGDGTPRISLADLHSWVRSAVALAPDPKSAAWTRKVIAEALGPFAYFEFADGDDDLLSRPERN